MKKTQRRASGFPAEKIFISVLAIIVGIIFIVSQGKNAPIKRDEAVAYSGEFESYRTGRNYVDLNFADGSSYSIYPHTEKSEFRKKMQGLEEGTRLYILVNPNNNFVAEIRTDTEELMNFEGSQREIDSYDNGYIAIGAFMCVTGAAFILLTTGEALHKIKEDALKEKTGTGNSLPIREAGELDKSRVFLRVRKNGYDICYRRVKHVNELVINGLVYDERKGIIEFDHNLRATLGGNTIEAGLREGSRCYILYNGRCIAEKERMI